MKENKNRMIDRQIKVTIPLLNLVSLANHDMRGHDDKLNTN